MLEPSLGMDMHEAIERLARYVYNSGAFDTVDESVEIRLYGEAKDIFMSVIMHLMDEEDKQNASTIQTLAAS
jgi:hypothetical protein